MNPFLPPTDSAENPPAKRGRGRPRIHPKKRPLTYAERVAICRANGAKGGRPHKLVSDSRRANHMLGTLQVGRDSLNILRRWSTKHGMSMSKWFDKQMEALLAADPDLAKPIVITRTI